jgi:hypothetical protein
VLAVPSYYIISDDSSTVYFDPDFGFRYVMLKHGNDTIMIKDIELSVLPHGLKRSKSCSDPKWFLFMKFYKRCEHYTKYKFREKDIKPQLEKPWLKENPK